MSAMFKSNQTSWKKGNIPWNKGKKLSKEYRKKLSMARLNSPYRNGILHPRWKGGSRGYFNAIARKILEENKIKEICFICNKEKRTPND